MDSNSGKKHILFLPEWYPNPEDPQLAVFVEKFARAAAKNSKVSLIFCGPFAKENKIELTLKKEGDFTSYFCYYPKQKRRLRAYNYFIKAHEMCFDKLKEDGIPDLIHLHMLFRNYVAYKTVYANSIKKFMITEQWSGYIDGKYNSITFLKKRQYKKAFHNAYFVTAVSKKLAAGLNNLFEIQNNVIILPNIAEKDPVTVKKSAHDFNILVVADLVDEIKNISGVIDAYQKCELKINSTLTIIGDGKDKTMLEEKASKVNYDHKKIKFLGRLENKFVLAEMQQNHILVTNSRHETFSMVTAEALLAGLPVICTRCGGPEEFVNESNGILIDVDNTDQLAEAITILSSTFKTFDPETLSQPVLDKFGINTVAKQLDTIYTDILKI